MSSYRNNTLDVLKLFASYMVVFIHVLFSGKIGVAIDALARFAVPFFFLVSGFYSYKITPDKIKKRITHIFSLLVFAVILHTVYHVICLLLKHEFQGLLDYFAQYLNVKNLLKLILFNAPVQAKNMWYLFSILYVYVIYYFVTLSKIPEKVIFVISVMALFLNLLMGEIFSAFGIVIPNYIVRNFALTGIPFFGLGLLVKKHIGSLQKVPNYILVLSAIIGAISTLCSRYLFGKNELYIGSVLILFSLVVVFTKYPNVKYPSLLISLAKCSTYIYIVHSVVFSAMLEVGSTLVADAWILQVFERTLPLIVCVITTVLSYMIVVITKRR